MTALIKIVAAVAALGTQGATVEDEFKQLQQAFQKENAAFQEKFRALSEEDRKTFDFKAAPGRAYAPRFLELAKKAKDHELEDDILAAAITASTTRVPSADVAKEALELMIARHADSPLMPRVANTIAYGLPFEGGTRGYLQRIAATAKTEPVISRARISEVRYLTRETSSKADIEEGRALAETLRKDYPNKTYGDEAEAPLFERERLQIGMVAPDFDAIDENGKPWKLSDYRGKVVVLDFWGFW